MAIPAVESHLPELMCFVESLARDVETGDIAAYSILAEKVRQFFTVERMAKFNASIPGWQDMAAYADGQTLIHVMTVFTALLLCPEYRQATLEQQILMKWIVLFHDLAKVIHNGKRDPTHAFRSAALAGSLLGRFAFAVTDDFNAQIAPWVSLLMTARTRAPESHDAIQDNRQLPEIVEGIGRLFGPYTPAALLVQGVLFHQSINVLSKWPQAAPLNEPEIQRYMGGELLSLLKIMMLVDNDAWAFFDPQTKRRHRTETLAAFRQVEALIHRTK